MSLWERITYLFKRKTEEVHCQYCGEKLTQEGGLVTVDGRVFCNRGDQPCIHKTAKKLEERITCDYHEPKGIQKAIRKKRLTQYSLDDFRDNFSFSGNENPDLDRRN